MPGDAGSGNDDGPALPQEDRPVVRLRQRTATALKRLTVTTAGAVALPKR